MPKKYRLMAFLILMGVNLLFHVGPLAFCLVGPQAAFPINPTNIPDNYKFLLFPNNDSVFVYKSEKFLPDEKIIKLDRAVQAEYKEIKNGAVGVMGGGLVSASDLSYLPHGNSEEQLKAWQAKLSTFGIYTVGKWDAKVLANGHKEITLLLKDDKHARSHTYSYETDGKELFSLKPIKLASGVAMAGSILLCLRFLFFTGIIWFIVTMVFKNP